MPTATCHKRVGKLVCQLVQHRKQQRRPFSSSSAAAGAVGNAAVQSPSSPLPPVRLALLGCGVVAEAHLNAAAKFKIPVQVTAAIDLDPARIDVVTGLAARLPDQGEVVPEGFQTVDDCLATAADRVDVVAVFLPHNVHEQFAVQLLSTDKHIMLEKPMAPTVAECERCASSLACLATCHRIGGALKRGKHDSIMAAARSHSGVFMLAENSSFWPEVTRAKQLLDAGAIGELVTARSHYYEALNASPFADEGEWLGWRKDLEVCGGGIVLDGGQHWLRPLREFMGEVSEVMAVTQRPFKVIEGESLCHALLRFESGKIASFQATVLSKSARMAHTEEPFFRLIGQEGDIVIAGTSLHGEGSVKLFTEEHPDGKEMMDVSSGAPLGYMDSFGPQLENLVAAVRNEAPLHRDASFAVNDIRVAQAIYRSNATGLWEAPV